MKNKKLLLERAAKPPVTQRFLGMLAWRGLKPYGKNILFI